MATYRAIQQEVKATYGFVPKTSWIADVLSERRVETPSLSTRPIANVRVGRCPPDKKPSIEAAIDKLG